MLFTKRIEPEHQQGSRPQSWFNCGVCCMGLIVRLVSFLLVFYVCAIRP